MILKRCTHQLITNFGLHLIRNYLFIFKLADYYVKAKSNGANFEIVFVSSDRDEESFEAYYGEMPWMALPFADRDKKQQLSSMFGVRAWNVLSNDLHEC